MKKILSLLLILVLALSLCACKKEQKAVEAPPEGTYKTIGIYSDIQYTLKKDLTFTATDSTSGTYELNTDGSIWFSRGEEQGFNFEKKGDYYYRKDVFGGFDADISENFLAPTFDEKGSSNQSFYKGIGLDYYKLDLKEDGTYYANREKFDEESATVTLIEEFEGTYTFKDGVLWLKHGKNKYPMIYDNATLFFDVIEKVK